MAADNSIVEIINHFDVCTADMNAARAIADCAAVLIALERSERASGAGWADGYRTFDRSLPDMLKHAVGLIDMAHNEADLMRETALDTLNLLARALEEARVPK